MDHEKILGLTAKLQEVLKGENKRYVHSVAVANTSMCLAARFGMDIEKAYIAGLLHDNAKCIDYDTQIRLCKEKGVEITDFEIENPYLIHGKLGAYLVKTEFGIDDRAVSEAIKARNARRLRECVILKERSDCRAVGLESVTQ